MLILAGVSLNATIGENGIILRAEYANFLNEMAAVEESVQLWKASKEDQKAIPTKGLCSEEIVTGTERLSGEVGYYRIWSLSNVMPTISVLSDASTFNSNFGAEIVFYPAGAEDLYFINNEEINADKDKTYLIDATNGMIYSSVGINLRGVRCYSAEMAKAVMSGIYDIPNFNSAEVSGGSGKLAGNKEDPNGFQIIADSSNDNIYKLYNNGDLYAKGLKGYLMNSTEEEMNEIDSTIWTKFSVPSEVPGASSNDVQIIPSVNTMYVIDSEGYLWAWGDNSNNKLGLTKEQRVEYTGMVPTKLDIDGKKVYKIFPTTISTYVITISNGIYELYACGYNNYGQLGTGEVVNTPDKFKKVDIETPEKIINITNQAGKDPYDLILMEASPKNKIYFCGATYRPSDVNISLSNIFGSTNLANKNVTKYTEIFNGTYGDELTYNVKNLYRGGDWNGTHINMLADDGKLYRLVNMGTIEEIKINGNSVNVMQLESYSRDYCLIKINSEIGVEFFCNRVGSSATIFGDVNTAGGGWNSLNAYFPAGLSANEIKDFYVTDSNIFYIMNNGKVYISGRNAGAGIGKSSGDIDNIICINDISNLPLIDSFVGVRNTGDGSAGYTLLLKGKDGNLYGTGNAKILFCENILQKTWKKIASNVKIFNARTTGDSLAYIDTNNDLWILGADSNYFGMNRSSGEKIRNFVRLKDCIEGTEMYNHIDGKVVDYALGSSSLRILTNEEDNNTIYVSGYYQSSTWYIYNFLGINDTANHFEFAKVMDNVKFFYGKNADNFAITNESELYCWGLFDGNGIFSKKNLPQKVNLSFEISDGTIPIDAYYQLFIIDNGNLYNAGPNYEQRTVNGMNKSTVGNFTQYSSQTFNNEKVIDVVSCNNSSFIVLTEEGNLYGLGKYCDLGINNTDASLKTTISKIYSDKKITQVVGGNGWFVAVSEDGEVFGTGSNTYGILGRWIGVDRSTPNSRYKTAFNWVECPDLEI